jgi:predicted permease
MSFFTKLWNSISSRKLNIEIQREIETHLALIADEARAKGLSPQDAQLEARRRFGNHGKHFENTRDTNLSNLLDDLTHDLRFALRQMRRNCGFTIVAVLVIGLGIGSVTTIFTLVDAVLIHSLPYDHAERLVYLWTPNPLFGPAVQREIAPMFPDFYEWQRTNQSFSSLAMVDQRMVNLANGDAVKRIGSAFVTGSFFEMLEAKPKLGRTINSTDDKPGHGNVAVISDAVWRQQFSGNPDAIGKPLVLNREKYTVIGVMPSSFGYPFEGDIPYVAPGFRRTEVWIPLALDGARKTDRANFDNVAAAIGRLRPGVSVKQAQAELIVTEKRLDVLNPAGPMQGWLALVAPFTETILGPATKMLWLLMAAVGLVLMIACGNVANLLLARVTGRFTEIALRTGLGAGRNRILRQMLTESMVLAFLGGAVGVVATFGAVRVLAQFNPGNIPRFDQMSVNLTVLALAIAGSVLSGVLFGLAPMLAASKTNFSELLKSGNRGMTGSSNRLRHALIVTEVALAFVLLTGAVLLIRSDIKLQAQNSGFASSTLTMNLPLDGRYGRPEQRTGFFLQFLEKLRHLPGVVSAGASSDLPLDHSESLGDVEIKGFGKPKGMIDTSWVTPGYFEALGLPLLAGRPFDGHDIKNVASAVIVNHAFVNAFMQGQDPLTFQVRLGSNLSSRPWASVVGVVGNIRHSTLEEKPRPEYFQPYRRSFDAWNLRFAMKLQMPEQIAIESVRRALHDLDPALALDDVRTMKERMAEANSRRRFQTVLLTAFAVIAVFLAMIGIYGVIAFLVRQRTPEIGLRMALGASSQQVLVMVVRQGLGPVAIGLAVGVGIALLSMRIISTWLYGIGPNDPLTFGLLPMLVLAVAACACLIPAVTASRVDPAVAIRNE